MLKLIQNEYSKIFHKVSSYVMLGIWMFILFAIPVGGKIISSLSNSHTYYGSIENELAYAKENEDQDPIYVQRLEKAQELGLTLEDLWGDGSWKGTALSDAFNYISEIYYDEQGEGELTEKQKTQMQEWADEILTSVEQNDWKVYYQKLQNIAGENTMLPEESKTILKDYYAYLIDENISPEDDKNSLQVAKYYEMQKPSYDEMVAAKEKDEAYNEEEFKSLQKTVLTSEYAMVHHTMDMIYENSYETSSISNKYVYNGKTMNAMENGTNAFMVIFILLMVVAGTMISNEYSQGTIKFLLINPVKRQKIFWSKFITVITLALAATLVSFLLEMFWSGIVYGFDGLGAPLLVVQDNAAVSKSGILFMFGLYMAQFLQAVIAVTISFALSALFRNSGIAIALGIIVYAAGGTISMIASMMSLDFVRYTIFANMNVPNILAGIYPFEGMTTGFSVAVIAVHIFLLLFIARDAFVRKNV